MLDKKLRILVVSQYFWPEDMRINDMVEGFTAKGHEVTVLTGLPNYPDGDVFSSFRESPMRFSKYHGARVVRVPLLSRGRNSIRLALNYLSFLIIASLFAPFKLRGERFDAIFVYAVSPITAVIPALIIGRIKNTPVLVWVLDLWPETLRAVGVIKNQFLLGVVGKLVSWIYNRSDYLLIQSKSFKDNVLSYCTKVIDPERIVYFPSWAEDIFLDSNATETDLLSKNPNVFTVLFAGNLGEAQDFPAILDAVALLKADVPVRWVVVGDGRMRDWLHEQIERRELSNVVMLGRHPVEAMPGLFACADALLVSLRTNDVFEKTVPGKVQAYLSAARPIVAMIDGEASRVIEDSCAGLSCPSGDAVGLARIVSELAATSEAERENMGIMGKAYYLEHFSKKRLFSRLETLFQVAKIRR